MSGPSKVLSKSAPKCSAVTLLCGKITLWCMHKESGNSNIKSRTKRFNTEDDNKTEKTEAIIMVHRK